MRINHWIKNLMIFFPPWLSGRIHETNHEIMAISLISFCFASSSVYIINDIMDKKYDKYHEEKNKRPIANGDISTSSACFLMFLTLAFVFYLGLHLKFFGFQYIILYIIVSLLYSLYLKCIPILEIFLVSFGFIVRLYYGGFVFDVKISPWLSESVVLLSLFLVTGKRLGELKSMKSSAKFHREVLALYNEQYLTSGFVMLGTAALVTYSQYVIMQNGSVLTLYLCLIGLLRYMYIVLFMHKGDPTIALLRDKTVLFVGILWAILVTMNIYT